ncbi:hypoxanthine phosphoribosyltransferase [Chloroflexota bacterium]
MKHEKLTLLYKSEDIAAVVARIGEDVTRDYSGSYPLFLGVLKGSFMFMADLVRCLDLPLELEFVTLSSYGSGIRTSGDVKVVRGLNTLIRDRDVLVVEDIVDTGLTLDFFLKYLTKHKPASVKVCALLDKEARRIVGIPIDYRGFMAPNRFLVGYGLDYNQKFRQLPDIYILGGDNAV